MKKYFKTSWASLFVVGCLAFSLTACLNENEDNTKKITKEEVQQAYRTVAGTHTGKLVFPLSYPLTASTKTDSLDISWDVTSDSTLLIKQMPAKAFVPSVQDNDVKNLLMKAKPQDLKCNIGFYSLMPVAFVMQPKILEYQVENNGKQSKIEVLFYFNVRGAAGVYNVGKKTLLGTTRWWCSKSGRTTESRVPSWTISPVGRTKEVAPHGQGATLTAPCYKIEKLS